MPPGRSPANRAAGAGEGRSPARSPGGPMLSPEPLPARLGRVAAGFSPPLAARLTSLALELHPDQAQRLLSLVVDVDDEVGNRGLESLPAPTANCQPDGWATA